MILKKWYAGSPEAACIWQMMHGWLSLALRPFGKGVPVPVGWLIVLTAYGPVWQSVHFLPAGIAKASGWL